MHVRHPARTDFSSIDFIRIANVLITISKYTREKAAC